MHMMIVSIPRTIPPIPHGVMNNGAILSDLSTSLLPNGDSGAKCIVKLVTLFVKKEVGLKERSHVCDPNGGIPLELRIGVLGLRSGDEIARICGGNSCVPVFCNVTLPLIGSPAIDTLEKSDVI